jgi:hypothetical protein
MQTASENPNDATVQIEQRSARSFQSNRRRDLNAFAEARYNATAPDVDPAHDASARLDIEDD